MQGSTAEHQRILQLAMLDAQEAFPDARFFTRHVGLFLTLRGVKIMIGEKGQADLWMLLPIRMIEARTQKLFSEFLVHVEIEVKSGNATQNKDQKKWGELITSMGGLYIVVRKPEDIRTAIQEKYGEFL